MKNRFFITFLIFLFVNVWSACSYLGEEEITKELRNFRGEITLNVENLSPLKNGYYESWILVDGRFVSVTKFNVNNNKLVALDGKEFASNRFPVEYKAISETSRFMISMEPKDDKDQNHSQIVLLEGNINPLEQNNLYFVAYDTENMEGDYELRVFSDQNYKNRGSGIWFATKNNEGKNKPLLKVPALSGGWIYEAWLIQNDQYLSLGRFNNPSVMDDSNLFMNEKGGVLPFYPGEDLLVDVKKIAPFKMPIYLGTGNYKVLITLEPSLANFDNWFGEKVPGPYRVLEAKIPASAKINYPYNLINVAVNYLPRGSVKYTPLPF